MTDREFLLLQMEQLLYHVLYLFFYKWVHQLCDLVPLQWMPWIRSSPAMLWRKEVAEGRGLRQNMIPVLEPS